MTTSVTTPTQTPPDIRQRRQVNRARYGTNTYRIGQLLLRPEGVTYAEARAATGWRQLSMPPIAAACGLTFTTQRTGSVLRFFAAPVITVTPIAQTTVPTITAFASTPPTLDSLLDALQCDPVERTYFRNRTTNLSGSTDWAA